MARLALNGEALVRSSDGSLLDALSLPPARLDPVEIYPDLTDGSMTELHIVLEHDCGPVAVRDVVRNLARWIDQPAVLHMVEGAGSPQLTQHLNIALREVARSGLRLGPAVTARN